MKGLVKLVRLSRRQRRVVARAALTVAGFRAALTLLPFPWVRALGGRRVTTPASEDGSSSVEELVWAVAAASRRIPRATCLTQALALQRLLASEGRAAELKIGVAKDGSRLEAHAWLEADGKTLIGGDTSAFTPLPALPERDASTTPERA